MVISFESYFNRMNLIYHKFSDKLLRHGNYSNYDPKSEPPTLSIEFLLFQFISATRKLNTIKLNN